MSGSCGNIQTSLIANSPKKHVFGNNKLSKSFEWNPQPKQEAANGFSEKTIL